MSGRQAPTKVLYNSACPVCKSGIQYQQKRVDALENIDWEDIHRNPTYCQQINSSMDDARERLHVISKEGDIKIGLDAFIYLWQLSPKDKWKARFFSLPVIHFIFSRFYNLFAKCLFIYNQYKKRW